MQSERKKNVAKRENEKRENNVAKRERMKKEKIMLQNI